ncbi:MAG: hypothetical protein R3253_14440, partial [Longimicrobiales bacterium]|nr:hypothetical protein [Longimicrobiales bacterium]
MTPISRKDFLGLGSLATAGLAAGCSPASMGDGGSLQADLIVVNGNVLTQDDANPRAEAFALRGDRFVAVGSNDDIRNLAGPN